MKYAPICALMLTIFIGRGINAYSQVYPLSDMARLYYTGSSYAPFDSTHYKYSGGRTTHVLAGTFEYDSSFNFIFEGGIYIPNEKDKQLFGFDSLVLQYQQQLWNSAKSAWVNSYQLFSAYTVYHKDTTQLSQYYDSVAGVWINQFRYFYKYDSYNNLRSIEQQQYDTNTTSWGPYSLANYFFNSTTNLIDSSYYQLFQPPTGYVNQYFNRYKYNALNQLTSYVHMQWDPKMLFWRSDSIIDYTYNAAGNINTILYSKGSPAPVPASRDSMVYDSHNNLIAIINQLTPPSGLVNNKRYRWTYNTNNDPTVYITDTWTGSAWQPNELTDSMYRYYYIPDTSHPGTAVNAVNSALSDINIFPVPAHSILNIHLAWKNEQSFSISLYDVAGRLVNTWNEQPVQLYNKTLPVSNLASGDYFIAIKSSTMQIVKKITISSTK